MHTTSSSLLERLRQPQGLEDWPRFVQLYTPLLFHWGHRWGLQDQDAADLVQEVFVTLLQKRPVFRYDRERSFRNWLRTVAMNKWRDCCRRRGGAANAEGSLGDLAAPEETNELDATEHRQYLVGRALKLMQTEFAPKMWKACWEHVVAGRSAAEVAAELGISEGTVYVAKSRIMHRLRQELEGLLD